MQYLSRKFNATYTLSGLDPTVGGFELPTQYEGKKICDSDINECWVYDGTVWKPMLPSIPQSSWPALSGDAGANENSAIEITITNFAVDFDAGTTWYVNTTHGKAYGPDASGLITWHVGYIDGVGSETEDATLNVIVVEPDHTSNANSHKCVITNIISIPDQTVTYDSGSMSEFTNLWNMTPTTTLNSDYDLGDVFTVAPVSTTTEIYVDRSKIIPEIGDTFEIQSSEQFIVATVNDDGTDLYVTPEVALSVVPTQLEWLNHKAESNVITQDVADGDWTGADTIISEEKANNVIDTDWTQTTSEIYVDNSMFNARVGDVYYTLDETFKVKTVNNDGTAASGAITSTFAGGDGFSMMIDSNGDVWGTGENKQGQLGLGNAITEKYFTLTSAANDNVGNRNASTISCGDNHSGLIDDKGKIWMSGYNLDGQLGTGNTTATEIFKLAKYSDDDIDRKAVAIVCALRHTIVIDEFGDVWGTGKNDVGQLGLNNINDKKKFTKSQFSVGGGKAKAIAGGNDFTLIIDDKGDVWGTGRNDLGQLGLGNDDSKMEFTKSQYSNGTGKAKAIACGRNHSLLIDDDPTLGKVWGTGDNGIGQLGLNSADDKNKFTASWTSNSNGKAVAIATGFGHTVSINEHGDIYSTGRNYEGQLGDGTAANSLTFIKATYSNTASNTATNLECGFYHTILQDDSNLLFGVGQGTNGELSKKNLADADEYVKMTESDNTTQIGAAPGGAGIAHYLKYWVEPTTDLITIPTAVYPISEIAINNNKAVMSTIALTAAPTIDQTFNDIDFNTRDIQTQVRSPELAEIQKISYNLNKAP